MEEIAFWLHIRQCPLFQRTLHGKAKWNCNCSSCSVEFKPGICQVQYRDCSTGYPVRHKAANQEDRGGRLLSAIMCDIQLTTQGRMKC